MFLFCGLKEIYQGHDKIIAQNSFTEHQPLF